MSYAHFSAYADHVSKTIDPDTEEPAEVVQLVAVRIGMKLSCEGKLPVSCGTGLDLDLDIVNEGILAGLEQLSSYNPKKGTLRQFLWKSMAGAMYDHAWERESVTGFLDRKRLPHDVSLSEALEGKLDEEPDEDAEEKCATVARAEQFYPSIEDQLIEEEESRRSKSYVESRKEALKQLSARDRALLMKSARIGSDKAKRDAWATELGISYQSLAVAIARARKKLKEIIEE